MQYAPRRVSRCQGCPDEGQFYGQGIGQQYQLLCCLGVLLNLLWPWYLSVTVAAALFAGQLFSARKRDRTACFKAFLNNNRVGFVIFLGFLGHFLLAGSYSGAFL